MRILTLHSDFIEFRPVTKALKEAESVEKKPVKIEECLVVLTAVERRDEANPKAVVRRLVGEVASVAGQVKAKTIVLYPYVHLSSSPAAPSVARQILIEAEKELAKQFKTIRAPFGWYKEFNVKCKGHPLAELSREFGPEEAKEAKEAKVAREVKGAKEEVSKALAAEKKLVSNWFILDTNGKLHPIKFEKDKLVGFDFLRFPNLQKFAEYELKKVRVTKEEPAHVKYMRKLELVDYEPGSDPGNLRYYPKGRLVKSLLERFVTQRVKAYGGMEIESPIMYDYEHPALKAYLNRFPARQYTIQTPDKKVFLRFAACFGQFLMAHDANISYKNLPLKLYELTRYSFRVEQHGELAGLRRLRAFTMPDCHAICADLNQAKEELLKRFELCHGILGGVGFKMPDEFEMDLRLVKSFWEENKDFLARLAKKWGKPVLVEMWDEQFFYFVMKYSWNFVDALGKAGALTTDQIDVENPKHYDITYIDKAGRKVYPLLLHCSPSGAVERVIWALLERAYFDEKAGKAPMLPVWLSPTQLRIIPVSTENHLKFAEKLAAEFEKEHIRVDIDDGIESVGKRIRRAELDWVPYVLVVGEKEAKGKAFIVRVREQGKEVKMTKKQLVDRIKKECASKPFDTLPEHKFLSKRPVFVG